MGEKCLTPSGSTVLQLGMTDILTLAVNGVHRSPACWPLGEFVLRGYAPSSKGICPDHAIFDFWIEHPGTGWYEMCQEAGYDGYDGEHPAWAVELDKCWLSWDQSSNSLAARLIGTDPADPSVPQVAN
jgi:hypothetical protein